MSHRTSVAFMSGLAVLSLAASSQAALLSINVGNAGTSTERGVAFNLTNNSATETARLTGAFQLPITTAGSESYSLWTRAGTVVGNVGAGATGWTDRGTATAVGQSYGASNTFNLTSFTFAGVVDLEIAPGATLGIWLKDADATTSFRYVNGGSNTVSSADEFSAGGSLTYTGHIGLGTNGASPTVANSTFGPTRNFMGRIGYVVPEPATLSLLAAAGTLVLLRRR